MSAEREPSSDPNPSARKFGLNFTGLRTDPIVEIEERKAGKREQGAASRPTASDPKGIQSLNNGRKGGFPGVRKSEGRRGCSPDEKIGLSLG